MKNQLFTTRILNVKTLILFVVMGFIFSFVNPYEASSQTIIQGQLFVYKSTTNESDTTGLQGSNLYVKFYKFNESTGQLVFYKSAPIDSAGFYKVTVYTTQDLYAIIPSNDPLAGDNFATSYYPGWLDLESADPISMDEAVNGVIDYDWGAVGKEIVERPSGSHVSYINGTVKTVTPNTFDDVVMVNLLDVATGNLITSAPLGTDGRYSLPFSGEGNYEVFVSIPGFASQSQYVTAGNNTRGDYNVNFNLDVYRGEAQTSPVNTVAEGYSLSQNYPNPFNPSTKINFTVPTTGHVKLTVYDAQGKQVSQLVNDLVEAGSYDITFNGSNLSSGIYYYTLQVGNNVITKKMNLIK